MRRLVGRANLIRPPVIIALIISLSILTLVSCEREPQYLMHIGLDAGWSFRQAGTGPWHDATVPGCVHTDLLANGMIGDPFYRDNEASLRWIEEKDWEYRTVIVADDTLFSFGNIELVFEGLDTYADVYVNDSLLLRSDNMFRRWRRPCRALLHPGPNELRVRFRSPVDAAVPVYGALGYELPGGPKVVTRKAGYHYGWDWGPRLVTSGIWRPARLVAWDRARIVDLQVRQLDLTEERARCLAVIDIESSRVQICTVSIAYGECGDMGARTDAAQGGKPSPAARRTALICPGMGRVEVEFEIPEPRLWWTRGLGGQFLYRVTAELKLGGAPVDLAGRRIGLRTVEVVTEPDGAGETFYIRLNGVPVFMKGANVIPLDNFSGRVTAARYEALVRDAAHANMNMLRVWGGGIYEEDIFYDLCDEYGILVWQDFMFACAMYPGGDAFMANVAREAEENIRRLRNHPCIALWCGNNEIDEAWWNWGWRDAYGDTARAAMREGYERLFLDLLPRILVREDPGRFYWPSSPRFGRADPRSLTEGDSHYWGVWHDGEPFDVYGDRVGRFMSEFGFQSFPALRTVESFTLPGERELGAPVMRSHQKHPRGNELLAGYIDRYYSRPKDFASFVYVSQLLQAEGVRTAIEAHRRARPYCMGSLYWQLNDCWPAASWSSIDCYGRWKALHYHVRRAFADLLVSIEESGADHEIWIVSDLARPMQGELEVRLVDFEGVVLYGDTAQVVVPPASSIAYGRHSLSWLLGAKKRAVVLAAVLRREGEIVGEALHYFVPPKDLDLPEPAIQASIGRNGREYTVTLSTERLARNVYLRLDGADAWFSDNFFDLLPGRPRTVDLRIDGGRWSPAGWTGAAGTEGGGAEDAGIAGGGSGVAQRDAAAGREAEADPESIAERLSITTLVDTYRKAP